MFDKGRVVFFSRPLFGVPKLTRPEPLIYWLFQQVFSLEKGEQRNIKNVPFCGKKRGKGCQRKQYLCGTVIC